MENYTTSASLKRLSAEAKLLPYRTTDHHVCHTNFAFMHNSFLPSAARIGTTQPPHGESIVTKNYYIDDYIGWLYNRSKCEVLETQDA